MMRSRLAVILSVVVAFASGGIARADILDYYDVETIELPEGESSTDAVAFMPDGRLICVTSLSKVYTYDPVSKIWVLFAEGLHTPLGLLPLSDTEVLVAQRPELTLMTDTDGDGDADHFGTVSDYFGISGNYAEFVSGPVKDSDGNLFFGLGTGSHYGSPLTNEVRGTYSAEGHRGRMNTPVPYRGWIMKVTPEGETIPWASGFREPNGIGFDVEGRLFAIDNQGDWVGSSGLYEIREGGFYGHAPSLVWRDGFRDRRPLDMPAPELNRLRTRPVAMFPHGEMSNSPTQPLWISEESGFGIFVGQALIGEMNFNRIMRVMLEEVDGALQGAVVSLIDHSELHKGNNRLAFDSNGDLWIGQTKHQAWVGESGLQRLSWNGEVPLEIERMSLTDDGFELVFTRPIDRERARVSSVYEMSTYFYNYHEAYGSEKFDLREAAIDRISVSEDGLRVRLVLSSLEPWRLYDLRLKGLRGADGGEVENPWIIYTLNRLRSGMPPEPDPEPFPRPERRRPVLPEGGLRSVGGPVIE